MLLLLLLPVYKRIVFFPILSVEMAPFHDGTKKLMPSNSQHTSRRIQSGPHKNSCYMLIFGGNLGIFVFLMAKNNLSCILTKARIPDLDKKTSSIIPII